MIGTSHTQTPGVLIVVGALLAAMLLGLTGAMLGAEAQVLLLFILIPAIVLMLNQPLGLLLFILLVPYNGSAVIPRMAQNVVFFGIAALFFARLGLRMAAGKPLQLPFPREILLYVLLVTAAVAVGYTHLNEMTVSFKIRTHIESYGFKEYVVGFYAKQMTLVVMAGIIAWLTVQNGGRSGWIVAGAVASAVIFVFAMLAVLGSSGFSFDQIRTSRNIFVQLGRQSNNAGGLLFIMFASTLFMWEMAHGGGKRFVLLCATLLLMMGVLLTASRGAILAMLVVLFLYAVEFRRIRTVFAVFTLAAVAFALAPDAVHDRMLQGLDTRYSIDVAVQGPGDEVTSGRFDIWSRLAPEILRSPIIGRGLFSTQWSDFARFGGYWASHPHSLYLGILMDAGIVGVVVMFLFYRFVWRTFRTLGKDTRLSPELRGYFLGASAALIAYLVFGIPNGYWHPSPDQTYLWVAIGLAVGYSAYLAKQAPAPAVMKAVRRHAGRVPAYQRT
jgi:O-antigen ligase